MGEDQVPFAAQCALAGLEPLGTELKNIFLMFLSQVADFDFSPLSDDHRSNHPKSGCGPVCCRSCFLQPSKEAAWESHELLHSLYKPVKMYTL